LAHDSGQFLLAEDQQRKNSEDRHVGNGEHDPHLFPGAARGLLAVGRALLRPRARLGGS
jgi:hypothetical protein